MRRSRRTGAARRHLPSSTCSPTRLIIKPLGAARAGRRLCFGAILGDGRVRAAARPASLSARRRRAPARALAPLAPRRAHAEDPRRRGLVHRPAQRRTYGAGSPACRDRRPTASGSTTRARRPRSIFVITDLDAKMNGLELTRAIRARPEAHRSGRDRHLARKRRHPPRRHEVRRTTPTWSSASINQHHLLDTVEHSSDHDGDALRVLVCDEFRWTFTAVLVRALDEVANRGQSA